MLKKKKVWTSLSKACLGFVMISSLMAPAVSQACGCLKWNWLTGDKEILRMANVTKGDTQWADPITADAGDSIKLNVYYHCSWECDEFPVEKARNSKIRITFPNSSKNQIGLTAHVFADNVTGVYDSGLLHVSSAQTLSFSSTAKWHHGSAVDDISVLVSDNYVEVNLGDVSCDRFDDYLYDGSIVFSAQVSNTQEQAPTIDIKANGSNGPITIDYNTSANLTWASSHAIHCEASDDWMGQKSTSGSESTGNLTSSKKYAITCSGLGGTASDYVLVNVNDAPNPAPTVDLKANGHDSSFTVGYNTPVNLTWSSTNANFCTASGAWSGSRSTSGSESSGNLTSNTTFTLACSGSGGSASDSITVYVQDAPPAAPSVNIKANGYDGPLSVNYNSSVNLTWTSSNASYCTASGAWSGSKSTSGSESTGALTTSMTYGIICYGAGGSSSDSVVINVSGNPTYPGLSIAKSVRNITDNGSYGNLVSANPSDNIEFKIVVTSTGNSTVENVILTDTLPSLVNYQGNLRINGYSSGGDIMSGLVLGSLSPGTVKTVTFESSVAQDHNFGDGVISLTNSANVIGNNVSRIYSSAVLNVQKEIDAQKDFSVSKKVKNLTKNNKYWHESISADPGDEFTFRIVVSSNEQSATIYNIIVKDTLPSKMTYLGSLEVNGVSHSGDIRDGIDIGNLLPSAEKTITFKARAYSKGSFVYGQTTLINTVLAHNVDAARTDTAKVVVSRTGVAGGSTEINTGFDDTIWQSLLLPFAAATILLFVFKEKFLMFDKWMTARQSARKEYWANKKLKKITGKMRREGNI